MNIGNLNDQQFDLARNANDVAGLDTLRQAAQSGDEQALQKAAEQFEAIFVRMMLKSMRQAQDVLADENSPMNTQYMKFYRDMHDQQIASDLASGDGMGLAKLIVQQLGPQREGYQPASVIRTDGNLPAPQSTRDNVPVNSSASKQAVFEDANGFIDSLRPAVTKVADKLGIDPNALIAQAALETGWGKHMIHDSQGNNSYNLFGIKADNQWKGSEARVPTLEFDNGVAKRKHAAFRLYESIEASVNDYMAFVQQDRYQGALSVVAKPYEYFTELQKAGYATDPNYADKIVSIMQRIGDKVMGD